MQRILNNIYQHIDLHILLGGLTTVGIAVTSLAIKYAPVLQALSWIVTILAGLVTLSLAVYKFYKRIKQDRVNKITIKKTIE